MSQPAQLGCRVQIRIAILNVMTSTFYIVLEKSLTYPEAFFKTVNEVISFTCNREASEVHSFRLTIDCAFSLLNNVPRQSLLMIINSLTEPSFYIYTPKCFYLYPITAKFKLFNSCRNEVTEQIVGRNREI